jgi:hypothetical protein
MHFRLAPDFRKPVLDMERYKVMIACCIFEKRIQASEDCEELSTMVFEIGSADKTEHRQLASAPAISLLKDRKILFNLDYCVFHNLSNHYPAILVREIGKLFPRYSAKPRLFRNRLKDPDAGFSLFGVPAFDSFHPPFSEYAADYYACSWGFLEEVSAYRCQILRDPSYADVLAKYTDADQFRLAAYRYHKHR